MSTSLVEKVTSFEDAVQEKYNHKLTKIQKSPNKIKIQILELQYIEAYFNKKFPLEELLTLHDDEAPEDKPAYHLVQVVAGSYYNKNKRSTRIALDDFLSACYLKAWNIITYYDYTSNYWLYHYLTKYLKQACLDVLKHEGFIDENSNRSNRLFNDALPLVYEEEIPFSQEDMVIQSIALTDAYTALPEDEKRVFQVYADADNIEKVTLDTICTSLNLKHRQQAKRILNRLRISLSGLLNS